MTDVTFRHGVAPARILLPRAGADLTRWAVVACDQYSSRPEYWRKAEEWVGEAPSALRLIYPECWLGNGEDRVPAIHAAMRDYLARGVLEEACRGMVYVERQSGASGMRRGLVAAVDLEGYDYRPGTTSLLRPTEGTIAERLPPRTRVRRGAPVELPHVLILYDDPQDILLGPLERRRDTLRGLYDTPLMMGGGHARGWAVEDAGDLAAVEAALGALYDAAKERSDPPMLLAVGDGNHSLASAKAYWEEIKPALSSEERETHPARWALCELTNLHDPGLAFHPIHRVLFGVHAPSVAEAFAARMGGAPGGRAACRAVWAEGSAEWRVPADFSGLPLALLQDFLDEYLAANPAAAIDYVHGDAEAEELGRAPGNLALLIPPMDKGDLFPAVLARGVLPRKAFSMGEADEKRFYMEARAIFPEPQPINR